MTDKRTFIRQAEIKDAKTLLAIYAPYVEKTAVSFEYEVPSLAEFEKRIADTEKKYPYLLAQSGDDILGYAYAGGFKEREAYARSVETSIYVRSDARRCGVGCALYQALEKALFSQGILNLNACIASSEKDDEYLSSDSEKFHARMGYKLIGRFHECGFKFGRWYDMIWMEKLIGEHKENPAPVKTWAEISRDIVL